MTYKEKKEEMLEKYRPVIACISKATGMDMSVAQEMLEANVIRGANNPYLNEKEFRKDYEELLQLAGKEA